MKKATLFVAVALGAAVFVRPASAQFDLQISSDFMTQTALGNVMVASMNGHAERDAARLRGKNRRGVRTSGGGSRSVTRGTSQVSTRFRPSLAARQSVLARMVAQTRARDSAAADRLQGFLGGGDPIAPLKPTLARYGLRADDAADATALYLVVAWYGSRGLDKEPPSNLVRAVRTQVKSALPTLPAFARASNAAKQQMGDSMWIQTLVAASSINAAKGKPALMNQTKSAIRQGTMKAFKLDMTKLKLTNQGLRS